jgi:GTPase Era involved in 16S rRNA processing
MIEIPWSLLFRSSVTAYQKRHLVQHLWKNLLSFVDNGKTNIVVLGRPAVGKSVLTAQLYGEAANYDWDLPDTSSRIETKAIQLGEWTSLVRVIPGQETKIHHEGINEAFNEHKDLEGVIFVADWGFTGLRSPSQTRAMIEEGKDTIEKLRAFNLEQELLYFQRVCNKIKEAFANGRQIKWLLIAVNKADLFVDSIEEAQHYYSTESPFVKILTDLLLQVGKQNLKCAVMPIAAWEKDFVWNGETVKTNLGGTETKNGLFRKLIEQMADLSK